MNTMPTLFVSHGSPTLIVDDCPARTFLQELGRTLPRPDAIVAISAHYEESIARITASPKPDTIHDFYGFPQPLYELRYPAPGAPDLARDIAASLQAAGIEAEVDPARGLDHGAWVPLLLMYPQATIPVVQISLSTARGPGYHYQLGQALRPLRERSVLVLGSGSATHNLRELNWRDQAAAPADWALEFSEWLAEVLNERRDQELLNYRQRAPQAARNHPTEEHFLPLHMVLGVARSHETGQRLHQSFTFGNLAMDTYGFGV